MRSRLAALLVALVPAAGCVLDWDSLRPLDGGAGDAGDEAAPEDAGGDTTLDAGEDVVTADADAGACSIVLTINELQADGSQGPSDEFVELRNASACGGSLEGYELRYSSATGSAPYPIWDGQAGDTIAAHGYVTVAGQAFQNTNNLVGRFANGLNGVLSKNGGGVGLFGPDKLLVDSVAYETLNQSTAKHPFVQPPSQPDGGASPGAPNPPPGQSIARTPDGADTHVSAVDFQVASPSPGASN